jgi:hypothetical protein
MVDMKNKSAFLLGFHSGIANSLSLVLEREKIKMETKPFVLKKTVIGGIESDWAKLGGDMRKAMKYVATNAK